MTLAAKELEKPRVVAGCPVMNCMANMYCEFGHQVDEKGCTTCACKDDPCEVRITRSGKDKVTLRQYPAIHTDFILHHFTK